MLNAAFIGKALRNLFIDRDRPFFAHLFVTERCNLRCRYCEVWRDPRPELDEEGLEKTIDRLAAMGTAVLSFTGGEPLLRKETIRLIGYAKRRGMHTKITSNGTMPRDRYRELLESDIDAISISMDGVGGESALPYAKMDGRIIGNIEFMHARRGKKKLNVSTVYFGGNESAVRELVDFLERGLPGLEVFVQPVVSGQGGAFRPGRFVHVDMDLLRELETRPSVVNPRYFNDHCAEYFRRDGRFPWGCKAGRMFFDIKPDGEFWMCQDQPTGLNVLDPGFMDAWRALDTECLARQCSGCTYSCYVLTQKSFELKNAQTWFTHAARL
ncbi:MAG: radical SAM protein [Deltaproteobacteria bacterium]|nr:radical SAM protein [Deltaproteobacteria bacterium]